MQNPKYTNIQKWSEELQCCICMCLLAPGFRKCDSCDTYFCRHCVSAQDRCPVCRIDPINLQYPNRKEKLFIEQLHIFCICSPDTAILYKDLTQHVQTCPKQVMQCEFCEEHHQNEQLLMHYQSCKASNNKDPIQKLYNIKIEHMKQQMNMFSKQIGDMQRQIERLQQVPACKISAGKYRLYHFGNEFILGIAIGRILCQQININDSNGGIIMINLNEKKACVQYCGLYSFQFTDQAQLIKTNNELVVIDGQNMWRSKEQPPKCPIFHECSYSGFDVTGLQLLQQPTFYQCTRNMNGYLNSSHAQTYLMKEFIEIDTSKSSQLQYTQSNGQPGILEFVYKRNPIGQDFLELYI